MEYTPSLLQQKQITPKMYYTVYQTITWQFWIVQTNDWVVQKTDYIYMCTATPHPIQSTMKYLKQQKRLLVCTKRQWKRYGIQCTQAGNENIIINSQTIMSHAYFTSNTWRLSFHLNLMSHTCMLTETFKTHNQRENPLLVYHYQLINQENKLAIINQPQSWVA